MHVTFNTLPIEQRVVMGRFTPDTTVFENQDVLRDAYVPNTLLERESEADQFLVNYKSILSNKTASNVFVYGQTGVGKTMSTKLLMDELAEDVAEADGISLNVIWENCHDNTSYQTAISLVNQFRDTDEKIRGTGYPKARVHSMLWDEVRADDATHVLFVLDEVDGMVSNGETGLLYQIARANSQQSLGNTSVSMIGISNNFRFREQLEPKTRNSMCEREIHFAPYNADQLRSIVTQRSEKAFYDNTIDDGVINLIAAKAASDTGSARQAIDILHHSGMLAREEGEDTVSVDIAERAVDRAQRGRIMDELRSLPKQSHHVLRALLNLQAMSEMPARTKRIYQEYEGVAKSDNSDVKSQRTIHNRLSDLSLSGFLNFKQVNKGERGGVYNTYDLEMDPQIIADVLDEVYGIRSEQTELI